MATFFWPNGLTISKLNEINDLEIYILKQILPHLRTHFMPFSYFINQFEEGLTLVQLG
jgi:hypothetical protein